MQQPFDRPGRTRWRRFAALMVPATAVAGAIVFGMANGAIAASFAVSGQTFKVSATELRGEGFVQYGGLAEETDGKAHPVAVSGIRKAELDNLCQSVKVPGADIVLTIRAGGNGKPARASGLMIDMDSLEGDAEFKNINIGQDASTLDAGPKGAVGARGAFGQQADTVTIKNLRQVARSTHAGTFTLTGLRLAVNLGAAAKECF
ncbi:cholesterol esterase [Micromonospora sonchi]|uniref:Cholesterol esterase n=2 Tax=Micromonospora sonchi TaxID=1763543 RepID=A0A917U851_9ACTN|nr:cholesterol esterase [Micromonospora sonchi]